MVEVVGKFEKVSKEQWHLDAYGSSIVSTEHNDEYDLLILPERSTANSAGYDFYSPETVILSPGESRVIKTGVKCKIKDGWFLGIFPRSGLGFKYRLRLNNTVGIIDSDYYNNDGNEGNIAIKVSNEGEEVVEIQKGNRFAQGIFIPYGITEDDEAEGERNGGFGSSGI